MLTLEALHNDWATHPLGKNRARGGRVALGGFLYQLYLSLDSFFAGVLDGRNEAQFAFEGLSDLARLHGDIVYLTQVKVTLDSRALHSAVEESLAVWRFLREKHPDLLHRVRFQFATRRVRGSVPIDVGSLSATELLLEGDDRDLWTAVRKQVLPVLVRADPKVDLAIRLWPHARQSFTFVHTCLGRLFALLGENRPSTEITEALIALWDTVRTAEEAPCFLLGPSELSSLKYNSTRIVHGVRPRPNDLCDGCFMDRPALLQAVLKTMRDSSDSLESARRRQPIPVFWIVGPSGAGKSSLLLQVMRELVLDGDFEAANYLGEFAHVLPRSLAYWSGVTERALIVVDDLFAPENRDPLIWRNVAEVAFTATWQQLPWILTCGPTEQFKAFKAEIYRHPGFAPVEIGIEPMSAKDRGDYHTWYEQRTGVRVPISKEPILVAATWLYELRRGENLSPEEFTHRFYARLKDLGIADAALAALSLNQHGLKAPERLFAGHVAELNQLASERLFRLADPNAILGQGRFFHPRITKIIYDLIVPESELHRRAEHLAHAFAAMLDSSGSAEDFMAWLDAPRTQSIVSTQQKKATLIALWPTFQERGPRDDLVPELKRWHAMARSATIDVKALGVSDQIAQWFRSTPSEAASWGLLFQMVWDDANDVCREHLYGTGKDWLERFFASAAWNWIWQHLWAHKPNDSDLVDLGFLWLYDNPSHPGWSRVWQKIFDRGIRASDLLSCALQALPLQPETSADIPIWQKVETLQPSKAEFIHAIVRKLAQVHSPYGMSQGVGFVLSRVGNATFSEVLWPAVASAMGEPSWPWLWRHLVTKLRSEHHVLELGRDWLAGREEKPEWAHVWRRLVELGFEKDKLLQIGRDWLAGREEKPEWNYVWQRLVELGFEKDKLLQIGRDWLAGREDRVEYSYIFHAIFQSWPKR